MALSLSEKEAVRRYVYECQHAEQYRIAVREEFRVPVRMETTWAAMVERFVHEITRTLALRGRQEW